MVPRTGFRDCRGLNKYQYCSPMFPIELQYRIPDIYLNIVLAIVQASRLGVVGSSFASEPCASDVAATPSAGLMNAGNQANRTRTSNTNVWLFLLLGGWDGSIPVICDVSHGFNVVASTIGTFISCPQGIVDDYTHRNLV